MSFCEKHGITKIIGECPKCAPGKPGPLPPMIFVFENYSWSAMRPLLNRGWEPYYSGEEIDKAKREARAEAFEEALSWLIVDFENACSLQDMRDSYKQIRLRLENRLEAARKETP